MFYQTFSGTLGFAAAIGFIGLFVLFLGNKYVWNKNKDKQKIDLNFDKKRISSYALRTMFSSLVLGIPWAFFEQAENVNIPKIPFMLAACCAVVAIYTVDVPEDW